MKLQSLKPRIATLPTSKVPTGASWRDGMQNSNARGYTYRWQQESKAFLKANPLCMCKDCEGGKKRAIAATVVNHRIPHRGDQRLFWDRSNWEPMSKSCHDKHTIWETAQGL